MEVPEQLLQFVSHASPGLFRQSPEGVEIGASSWHWVAPLMSLTDSASAIRRGCSGVEVYCHQYKSLSASSPLYYMSQYPGGEKDEGGAHNYDCHSPMVEARITQTLNSWDHRLMLVSGWDVTDLE